jgi:hypothetical protein
VNQKPMALVAVDRWVLPEDCFVMLWFWLNMGARLYVNKFDHTTWNPIIQQLNPAEFGDVVLDQVQLLEQIYTNSNRKLLTNLPSSDQRSEVFCNIVDHLNSTALVDQLS